MAISAHQDDIELMAYYPISTCFGKKDEWFCGVVTTDGAGSPRNGLYADYTDEDMKEIRIVEQKKAAYVGEYGSQFLLGYPSKQAKDPDDEAIIEEYVRILRAARPKYLYTHNLADKHDTHLGVAAKVVAAVRRLDRSERPEKFYGCEVWRDLDWMPDEEKVYFDVSGHPNIAMSLVGVFDSQILGGKRYDLAAEGRRIANGEPRLRRFHRDELRDGSHAAGGRRYALHRGLRDGVYPPVYGFRIRKNQAFLQKVRTVR